jgi:hypothetical protein
MLTVVDILTSICKQLSKKAKLSQDVSGVIKARGDYI